MIEIDRINEGKGQYYHFPTIDFKFQNKGPATAIFKEFGIEVLHAEIDVTPVLQFHAKCIDNVLSVEVKDDGWGPEHNYTIRLQEPLLSQLFSEATREYKGTIQSGATKEIFRFSKATADPKQLERVQANKHSLSLENISLSWVCHDTHDEGKAKIQASNQEFGIILTDIGFERFKPYSVPRDQPPLYHGTSVTTYCIIIDPLKGSSEQKYSILRTIPSRDIERFHIMVGAPMSCHLQTRFKFVIDQTMVIESEIFSIHIWNPRNTSWHNHYTNNPSKATRGSKTSLSPLVLGESRGESIYLDDTPLNDQATSHFNQARTFLHRGQYEKAESLYERALEIWDQRLEGDHPNMAALATSLNNLGVFYLNQRKDSARKYEQTELLLVRALTIRERHFGNEHPDIATSLYNLALHYDKQKKDTQAEPLYLHALAIREQLLGNEHPDTASTLNSLAILYYSQGKYIQAESLFLRALAIREQHFGNEHPDTAWTLNNLAILYWKQGKYTQAEQLHLRVLAIREQHFGNEHPDTGNGLHNLALFYENQGKYERAEALYRRALVIFDQQLGPEDSFTLQVRENYASLLQTMGQEARANLVKASNASPDSRRFSVSEIFIRWGKLDEK